MAAHLCSSMSFKPDCEQRQQKACWQAYISNSVDSSMLRCCRSGSLLKLMLQRAQLCLQVCWQNSSSVAGPEGGHCRDCLLCGTSPRLPGGLGAWLDCLQSSCGSALPYRCQQIVMTWAQAIQVVCSGACSPGSAAQSSTRHSSATCQNVQCRLLPYTVRVGYGRQHLGPARAPNSHCGTALQKSPMSCLTI